MKFKELRERFQKGFRIPHHMNPSPAETALFMKNTPYASIRAYIGEDQNLYIWDANKAIHDEFKKRELVEYDALSIDDTGNFDPFNNTEGTILGESFYHPKFKKWTLQTLKEIENVFDGQFQNESKSRYGIVFDWVSNENA